MTQSQPKDGAKTARMEAEKAVTARKLKKLSVGPNDIVLLELPSMPDPGLMKWNVGVVKNALEAAGIDPQSRLLVLVNGAELSTVDRSDLREVIEATE